MALSSLISLLSVACALSSALAQGTAPLYGQCGGNGWTGSTACASGSHCVYSNPYYSQCLPGAGTTTAQPPPITTTPTTTTPSGPVTTVPSQSGKKPNFWFSFGDSYTATGFNANGAKPNDANPLGNPNFPGSSITPGANWIGWLTATYNASQVFTYNYAVSGAVIDSTLVSSSIPPVTSQVATFLNTVGSKPASTPWTSDNSLFSVFIGINDIGGTYSQGGDRGAFSDKLLDSYFNQVQKLYDVGARNFLFVNVPPVDRSPLMLGQSTTNQATEKSVIQGYNSKLLTRVNNFQANHSGVTTHFWDSWTQFTTILNSPSTYGFKDATSVGTAAGYFWGDVYHPTTAAHKLFAEQISKTVLSGTVW